MRRTRDVSFAALLLIAAASVSLVACTTKPPTPRVEEKIEPIPLDSKDPLYSSYLVQVRKMIRDKWIDPCVADPVAGACDDLSIRLEILFDILKDGRVARLMLVRSSGDEVYDRSAVNAIGRASPFPPPPPELLEIAAPESRRIRIAAALDYGSLVEESGIEGEPISLDSSDPKFKDYLGRVRSMIKDKWIYPCIKNFTSGRCDYKSATLVIRFGILRNGRVPWIEVQQTSGDEVYDNAARNAIRLAAPFPPVPPAMIARATPGSRGIRILVEFKYVTPDTSKGDRE